MRVSAIIPSFNAERFILRAVRSCLELSEISEVIVIDDGSTDNSLKLLSEISDDRLRILSHYDGLNHGRSASRNLGIKKAKGDWILFCDADDFCLPERLAHLNSKDHTDIDGYYDLIESRTENPKFQDNDILKHQGIMEQVESQNLLDYIISHRESWFSLIGLTIRKSAIERVGCFDESLRIAEDTDLIWKLAQSANIISGEANHPVAVRWVHSENSYQNTSALIRGRYAFYNKWMKLLPKMELSKEAKERITSSHRYYRRRMFIQNAFDLFKKK